MCNRCVKRQLEERKGRQTCNKGSHNQQELPKCKTEWIKRLTDSARGSLSRLEEVNRVIEAATTSRNGKTCNRVDKTCNRSGKRQQKAARKEKKLNRIGKVQQEAAKEGKTCNKGRQTVQEWQNV